MAKVYFYYSAMNAGKSTVLLQSSYNYHERGMRTLLFVPAIDTRAGLGRVKSRIGLEAEAITLQPDDNIFTRVCTEHTTTRAGARLSSSLISLIYSTSRCFATASGQISKPSFFPAALPCSLWRIA